MEQLKAEGRFDDPIAGAAAGRIVARFEAARVLTYAVVDERVNEIQGTGSTPKQCAGGSPRPTGLCLDLMNFLMDYLPDCVAGGN